MSERETALKEAEVCVFRVRTVAGRERPVTQWVSDCGGTWTPVTNVFDPSSRQTCPSCERPSRVESTALPPGDAPQTGADPVPVCQWRKSKNGLYADCGCTASEFFEVISVTEWKGCPYCLKPLALVPAEGDRCEQ